MSRSFLKVSRLIVTRGLNTAYDQTFHTGVNIIRGWNSTGKSTLMDFLVYSLGYELTGWTEHQLLCDDVIVEVALNNVTFCLKRTITETGKAPMYIFEGNFEEAKKDSLAWEKYSNQRSAERHSYSQQLFNLLGLPQHKNESDSNLTMHQILRLIYVDQLTSTSKLLKSDDVYDNTIIRRAIGEYLLGIDDLESHNLRQELIVANKNFESINGELNAIYKIFGNDASSINRQALYNELQEVQSLIENLFKERESIQSSSHSELDDETAEKAEKILEDIRKTSEDIEGLIDKKRDTNIELVDTKQFLESLEFRLNSLIESKLINSDIGRISFKYCPSCLSELDDNHNEHQCGLCKTSIASEERDFAYMQMMNELNFQIKESNTLVKEFQTFVDECNAKIPAKRRQLAILKEEYNDLLTFTNNRDALIAEVSTNIGYQKSILANIEDKIEQVEKVEALQQRKVKAQGVITDLEEKLEALRISNQNRYEHVYSTIENISKDLLQHDGGEEPFRDPEDIYIDFAKDKVAVNGRSKFSASSMVVLKNCIRLAIFLQAVEDKDSRLPNFLIMDNIEDKGMVAERSQSFQHLITEACGELNNENFQLIFTTSMIAEDLNNTPFCVGPDYPKGSHTLNIG